LFTDIDVKEIKDAMRSDGGGDEPQIALEACDRHQCEGAITSDSRAAHALNRP
jgi:hypothetical protein